MSIRILITGVRGSGKTTLAAQLVAQLNAYGYTTHWLDGDAVRYVTSNTDFSAVGRRKQASTVREMADRVDTDFVIMSLIAPKQEFRDILDPNLTLWMNTIDPDQEYENPVKCVEIKVKDAVNVVRSNTALFVYAVDSTNTRT